MSLLRAISDRVFGFDVFISYSRQDGSGYAQQLNAELARIGYRTFLDTQEMPPGEPLTISLRNALAHSSALVLIVSPGGLTSTFMPKEFDHYLAARRKKWKVVPISLGRTLDDAPPDLPLAERLRSRADVIWIAEQPDNLASGPSAETFKALIDGFHFTRRNAIRLRVISGVSALLAVLAGLAIFAAWLASERAQLALSRQLVAQSRDQLSSAPDLALLLAAEARTVAPTTESAAGLSGALGALAQLTGHEHAPGGAIERAAYSPEAGHFAALAPNGLFLWETAAWRLQATLRDPEAAYVSFAFHPDGSQLATCSGTIGIAIWRLEAPQRPEITIAVPNAVRVAFAPDRRHVLVGTGDGHLFLVDPASAEVRDLGEAHHGFITGIVLDFERGKFYTAGMSRERNVAGWDFATLRVERYFEGHRMSVNALALSADGAQLASAGEERVVMVWKAASGEARLRLASAANPVWKYGTPEPHGSGALDLAFLPGGDDLLAAYDDGRALVWNLATQKGGEMRAHLGAAFALAAQPNSRRFASGGADGKLRFWDLAQVHPAARLVVDRPRSRFLGFARDEATLCAAEEQRVRRWNIATGQEEPSIAWPPEDAQQLVAFSASSNHLALAAGEGAARGVVIRHGASYEHALRLVDAQAEPGKAVLDPGGRWFASPSAKSALSAWALREPPPREVPCQNAPRGLTALGVSPDGSWLIGGGPDAIMLWNPTDGRAVARLTHPANYQAPTAVTANARAKIVTAGYLQYGTVAFWEVRDPAHPRLIAVTHEHEPRSSVNAFAFNADGSRLLSLGSEGDAVLWQIPEAVAIARLADFGDGYMRCLPLNEAGTLAASSGTGGLLLFDLSPEAWERRARALAGRSLSGEERRAFLQPAR